MKIYSFRGKYHFLSNFSNSKIKMKGLVFDNAEAAFHAFKDPSRAAEFIGLNPSEAKSLGRRVKLNIKEWDNNKEQIMYSVVWEKFAQNPELAEKLIATGDAELIEGNTWGDKFWGICNGVGENKLGKILMDIRKHYQYVGMYFCPLCGEDIGLEPFCSECGEVAGLPMKEYALKTKEEYEARQIKSCGKIFREPVNYKEV